MKNAHQLMYCTNCGGSIEAAANFCARCGAQKLEPAPWRAPLEYQREDAAALQMPRPTLGGDKRAPSWLVEHGWMLLAIPSLAIVVALFEPTPKGSLASNVGGFIGWLIGAIAIASVPVAMSAVINRLRKAKWRSGVHDWIFAIGFAVTTLLLYLGRQAT